MVIHGEYRYRSGTGQSRFISTGEDATGVLHHMRLNLEANSYRRRYNFLSASHYTNRNN